MPLEERKYSENREKRGVSIEYAKQDGLAEVYAVKNELGNGIGYFKIRFDMGKENLIGVLYDVDLHPDFQHLGYDVMLYQKIAEIVNSRGCKFISNYPIEPEAKRVWESLVAKGFAQIDETKKDRQGHYFIEP